jgi:3-oxoacyl-[acyl-carrier protein] reductase
MVVNNAAAQPVQALDTMRFEDWQAMMATNLDGAFLVTQCAAGSWGDAGGAIVNIASIEGSDPAAGHAHYATSKAGVIMFSRAAALEYGPSGRPRRRLAGRGVALAGTGTSWSPRDSQRRRRRCIVSPQPRGPLD